MKTMTVGELKAGFSDALQKVKAGEEIVVEYGRKHEKVAKLVPYEEDAPKKRKVGFLKGVTIEQADDWEMTDEELLALGEGDEVE